MKASAVWLFFFPCLCPAEYHHAMPLGIMAGTLLLSYLIGAIPFGYVLARWRGVDIRQQGSGNIGATNVGRVLGRRLGILVFVLDFAKGAVPAAAATWLASWGSVDLPKDSLPVAAGLAAFVGHLFPIYLRFHGGKGVATGAGVVTVLLPAPALGALLTWAVILCAFLYVSLASLSAAVILCGLQVLVGPYLVWCYEPFAAGNSILTVFCLVAACLVFVRHRTNIFRLLHGTENRLPETPTMFLLTKTIHVLALGLWFGSVVFFTFSALVVFESFESLAAQPPPAQRPAWLPESFDKEKGTQLAGLAVGPLFPWYYLLQGVCGLLTVVTALSLARSEPQARAHQVRFFILALALATVIAAWPIANRVSALRDARYAADRAVAASAKADFGRWHRYSLLLNFATLGLVTVAMALAARLPNRAPIAGNEKEVTSRQDAQAQIQA